nr:hypothetical protein [Nitrospirota bacterium]
MQVRLLNLISTPVPVLNSLGLNLAVGLSSEDPVVGRRPSEPYRAYLSVYSPEGKWLTRCDLGEIPPNRRRLFPLSALTRELVPAGDHLVVVHRVPARLVAQAGALDEPLEMDAAPDYSMFRSLIQYAYPGRGNGSVIYETPPRLNVRKPGAPPSTTLTFSSKIILSQGVQTFVVPIHASMDPGYSAACRYHYFIFDQTGRQVLNRSVTMPAFTVRALDLGAEISPDAVRQATDPEDGLATFTFIAYSDDAALAPLILNVAPGLGGVSVEHTHPAQAFLMPFNEKDKNRLKAAAIAAWRDVAAGVEGGGCRVGG